jgi:hypothetical protein
MPTAGRVPSFRNINQAYLVTISSSQHGDVVARLPEQIVMRIGSEWEPALRIPGVGFVEKLSQELIGKSLKIQRFTAQVWSGNSPIEMELNLEFVAETNPEQEVLAPIRLLAAMVLPRKARGAGVDARVVPPGPRIFGISGEGANDHIVVTIGKFLKFDNVIALEASPIFHAKMDSGGRPLRAELVLRFRTMLSLTANDLTTLFPTTS